MIKILSPYLISIYSRLTLSLLLVVFIIYIQIAEDIAPHKIDTRLITHQNRLSILERTLHYTSENSLVALPSLTLYCWPKRWSLLNFQALIPVWCYITPNSYSVCIALSAIMKQKPRSLVSSLVSIFRLSTVWMTSSHLVHGLVVLVSPVTSYSILSCVSFRSILKLLQLEKESRIS